MNQANIVAFNEYANTAAAASLTRHYKLVGTINLSGITWTAIGDSANPFSGSFDGAGYTISNLVINAPLLSRQALFGSILNATIKNLGLVNVNVIGDGSAGSFVGYASGASCVVENCYATGSVTGSSQVGGIVGISQGTIANCYSAVGVNSSATTTGGIVGYNNAAAANVSFCYATGTVVSAGGAFGVGGIVGQGGATNCVALNPSITTPTSVGRVSGDTGGTVNYANSGMTALGGGSFGASGLLTKDGENVLLADAANMAWWNDPVGGGGPWVAGTSGGAGWTVNAAGTATEASPWQWGAGSRPRLWFE